MLIICLFGTIVVLLVFLVWYLEKYHDEWWDWHDFEVKALVIIATVVWLTLCLIAVLIQSSPEDTDVTNLLNSRHKIIAEINSDDPFTHNHGIDEAIEYNQKVKYGKDQLNSLWSNWFTSRMWADTEYIEVDIDSYIIIPDTKE